ncbi:MAG: redoxin domain-containing protein [Myxococcota bacterium]
MKAWISGALAATLVAVFAINARAARDRLEVGEAVKNFTLKSINPEESGAPYVGIDRYYGPDAKDPKKVILLSFFATYCEPCKREMPYLAALYDLYRDKGLMVMLISIDKEADKIEIAKTLAKEANVKFPLLSDRFNIVAKRYYISKLPCVYLVNGEGKVDMVNIGYSDDISKSLLDNIRKAVGEPTSDPVPDALVRYMTGHTGPTTVNVPGADGGGKPAEAGAIADAGTTDGGTEDTAEQPPETATKVKGKRKGKKKKKRKKRKKRAP